MSITDQLLGEKQSEHGDWSISSYAASGMEEVFRQAHTDAENTVLDEEFQLRWAAIMIIVKLSRIAAGDAHLEDHWKDISGYAQLALEYLGPCEDDSWCLGDKIDHYYDSRWLACGTGGVNNKEKLKIPTIAPFPVKEWDGCAPIVAIRSDEEKWKVFSDLMTVYSEECSRCDREKVAKIFEIDRAWTPPVKYPAFIILFDHLEIDTIMFFESIGRGQDKFESITSGWQDL